MIEALQYTFLRNALLAGILASIACGIVGTYVVINRIVFVSGGIAHSAYGGVGLAYYLGFDPVVGAVLFSLVSALSMGVVQRRTRQRSDTVIGVMWALGMAIGIILVDLTPGYKADLMSYLFGSILAVPTRDLWLMLGLDVAIVALVSLLYKELLAMSFDEVYTSIASVPVDALYLVLMCMIALTVVMLMRVVGLILLIALLTIPPAVAAIYVSDIKRLMAVAVVLGALFTTTGLWLSYTFNLTSGATIVFVAAAAYVLALAGAPLVRRHRRHETTSQQAEPAS